MTNEQWSLLVEVIKGDIPSMPLTGLIVDSPWIPGWYGITNLQYYSSEEIWFRSNIKVIETFPDIIFLPGFWSEYGMCTETSAFGSKLVWSEYSLPHAEKIFNDISEIDSVKVPNPKTDGLLPLMIQRLVNQQDKIREKGHEIKFAVSRGPLNIASFLLGTTELMMGFITDPEKSHKFLEGITQFIIEWIQYQKEMFPSIEGIFLLDDIVGFVGDDECREYVVPYLKKIYNSFVAEVNFFHNDAQGLVSSPYLYDIGINLFNFSFEHSLKEIRELAGSEVALVGNLPPRDVLASGTPEKVREETLKMIRDFGSNERVIWSCGGGVPPDVTTENIRTFKDAVDEEVPKL